MSIRVVAFDGDDTLWHNESRFNLTQSALRDLLRLVEPNHPRVTFDRMRVAE